MSKRTEVIGSNKYHFSVGKEVTLEKSRKFPIELQKAVFLGWEENLCVVIRLIDDGLQSIEFEYKEECVVRFFDEGKINRFHTTVLKKCKSPFFTVLFLMFPEHIYTSRYRENRRYSTSINGFLKLPDGSVVKCLITDMSIRGCCLNISTDKDFKFERKEFALTINDTAYSNIEKIKLMVLREEIKKDNIFILGCKILSFDKKEGEKNYEEILSFHESLSNTFQRVEDSKEKWYG